MVFFLYTKHLKMTGEKLKKMNPENPCFTDFNKKFSRNMIL